MYSYLLPHPWTVVDAEAANSCTDRNYPQYYNDWGGYNLVNWLRNRNKGKISMLYVLFFGEEPVPPLVPHSPCWASAWPAPSVTDTESGSALGTGAWPCNKWLTVRLSLYIIVKETVSRQKYMFCKFMKLTSVLFKHPVKKCIRVSAKY
jgi:hypothetical protein